jgi:hypothetical protein
MSTARRSLTATFLALLLVATGVFGVWLMTGSGLFASSAPSLDGPLPAAVGTIPSGQASAGALPLAANIQVSQPRDPFAPLTSEPPVTSSTLPGETTTTQPGATTTTLPGETTTTTTEGFDPEGTRVVLLEIREEGGLDKAVITVDGVTYVVGVGETFADSFKVVSLSDSSGVFLYGDSAFTLSVGQAILK